jgi:hypothetical protein
MLVTNHVLSGALLGHAAPSAPVAFTTGLVSHLALDALPHWGDTRPIRDLLHIAVPDGLLGLAVMAGATVTSPRPRRLRVLAGMAGAALLDLDKPSQLFFGFSPFPRSVDAVHGSIQRESPGRMPQELVVGVVGVALVAAVTRRASRTAG